MVGRELSELFPPLGDGRGEVLLEVRDITRRPGLKGVSFHVCAGEVLGISGLVGAGRTELARSGFGADTAEGGEVWIRGQRRRLGTPKRAAESGLAFATEDRKAEGLVLGLSVRENIALPSLASRQWIGFVRRRQERSLIRFYLDQLGIKTPSAETEVRFLSGGNQQKVVLAKWLAKEPEVLIFDEPTRGIDVGAKAEIYQLIREMAGQGKAVVMISSELPEILGMSDRILVMRDGRVSGELEAGQATEETILSLATSGEDGGPAPSERPDEDQARPAPVGREALTRTTRTTASAMAESWNVIVIFAALLALLIFSFAASEPFRSSYNLTNIFRQGMALGLVSIGQTLVMLAGGIDLSVGSVITLTNLFSAGLMQGSDTLIAPVVLLCLVMGASIGLVNGTLVVFLRIPAFIATLGTMTIGQGLALIYTRGPVGSVSRAYRWMADGYLGPLPVPAVILGVMLVLGIVFLRRVRSGHYIYAVGGNSELAHLSGIPVRSVQLMAYGLCGTLAAGTGLYLSSRMGSGDPNIGPGFELDSITAVIVGGTVLGGGRGGLAGTMGGVFLVAVLNNVLNLLDVAAWYQQIIKGLILLLAVSVYHRRD
jgi:ribose/xylose/arabinose/galactoside ABC-type transport system permease subunit/ABC-type Mn2+/Zn2+ transport system ATPase subunit